MGNLSAALLKSASVARAESSVELISWQLMLSAALTCDSAILLWAPLSAFEAALHHTRVVASFLHVRYLAAGTVGEARGRSKGRWFITPIPDAEAASLLGHLNCPRPQHLMVVGAVACWWLFSKPPDTSLPADAVGALLSDDGGAAAWHLLDTARRGGALSRTLGRR